MNLRIWLLLLTACQSLAVYFAVKVLGLLRWLELGYEIFLESRPLPSITNWIIGLSPLVPQNSVALNLFALFIAGSHLAVFAWWITKTKPPHQALFPWAVSSSLVWMLLFAFVSIFLLSLIIPFIPIL